MHDPLRSLQVGLDSIIEAYKTGKISDQGIRSLQLKMDKLLEADEKKAEEYNADFIEKPPFEENTFQLWTDGSCLKNPGKGGWAYIGFADNKSFKGSGSAPVTTNNVMELTAALEGIKVAPEGYKIKLYSDSKYLVDGMRYWVKNWCFNNWKKKDGSPVKNSEIWKQLYGLSSEMEIDWNYVKGHSDNPYNEYCDKIARAKAFSA